MKKKVRKIKKDRYELTELTRIGSKGRLSPTIERVLNKFDEGIARDGRQIESGRTNESIDEWLDEGEIIERLTSADFTVQYDSFFVKTESNEGTRISLHIAICINDFESLHYVYSISPQQHIVSS